MPGTQLQLRGLLRHGFHVALFCHTLVGRTNSGPLGFKGEGEPPTQRHKRKTAATKRTGTCVHTKAFREIGESQTLKASRGHRGVLGRLSSWLSWHLLLDPCRCLLTALLPPPLASLFLIPETECFFQNMALLPNIPYSPALSAKLKLTQLYGPVSIHA